MRKAAQQSLARLHLQNVCSPFGLSFVQSQESIAEQPTGAAAKKAVWNGAAWVAADSSSSDDEDAVPSSGTTGTDSNRSGMPRGSRQLGSASCLGDASSSDEEDNSPLDRAMTRQYSHTALGDASSSEEEDSEDELEEADESDEDDITYDDEEEAPTLSSFKAAAANVRQLGPLASDEELLGPLPDWKVGSAHGLRKVRHVTSAPILTFTLSPRTRSDSPPPLPTVAEASSEPSSDSESVEHSLTAPEQPAAAQQHSSAPQASQPIPIRQALDQHSSGDQTDSPVAHWLSPPEHDGLQPSTGQQGHRPRGRLSQQGGLDDPDEEDTLLGRFTKLDLSPSDVSVGEPGSPASLGQEQLTSMHLHGHCCELDC